MLDFMLQNPNAGISQDIEFTLNIPNYKVSVLRFRGRCEFSELSVFDVEIFSEENFSIEPLLGLEVELKLQASLKSKEMSMVPILDFVAIIASGESLGQHSGLYLKRLQLCSKTSQYEMQKHFRIFENKNTLEIITQVIPDIIDKTENLILPIRPYCTQYHETDLHFVQRIMAEDGLCLYPVPDSGQLEIHDKHSVINILPVDTLDDSVGLETRYRSIAKDFQMQAYNWNNPGVMVGQLANSPAPYQFAEYESGSIENDRNKALSFRSQVMAEQLETQTYYGSSMQSTVQVGGLYDIPAHLALEQGSEEQLLVIRCDYEGYSPKYLRDYGEENPEEHRGYFRCNFEARNIKERPFVVLNKWTKSKANGLELGIVEDCSDQENELAYDERACIRVRFGWDREQNNPLASAQGSIPMRYIVPWAGDQFGMVYLPRKGQEVLVSFLNDDIDQPVALAMQYNTENRRPYEHQHSGVKSRSTPLNTERQSFNELRFDDKLGQEEITLRAEKDLEQKVRNDQHHAVLGYVTKTVGKETPEGEEEDSENGHKVEEIGLGESEEGGNLFLECENYQQSIAAKRSSNISGESKWTSKSLLRMRKKSQHSLGSLELMNKGPVTVVVTELCKKIYEANYQQLVRKQVTRYFEDNWNLMVKANFFRKIEGTAYETVEGNAHWKFDDWKAQVTEGLVLESSKGITLDCGGNLLTVGSAGVTVFSDSITFNDGGSALEATDVELDEPDPIAYDKLRAKELEAQTEEQEELGDALEIELSEVEIATSDGSADVEWESMGGSDVPEHLRSLIRWQYCYSNDEEPKEDDAWQSPSASELDLEQMKMTITPPLENLYQHLHVCSFVADKWGEAQVSVKLKTMEREFEWELEL